LRGIVSLTVALFMGGVQLKRAAQKNKERPKLRLRVERDENLVR
jgi:hypothetical protein